MARVFLSYARDDQARAERIADALGAAGHDVWWDRHIGAGASFSREIDEALAKAELVVVLWSRHSIASDWVRDEAATGRDSGRLVPVLIDRIDPPLGFRQYQAVDLARAGRSADALVDAIDAKLGQPATAPRRRVRANVLRDRWQWIAGGVAILVLAGLLWLFLPLGGDRSSHVVAITAGEGGDQRRSQEMARIIATDLGRFRGGTLGALTVIGGGQESRNPDYRVEVSVSQSGADLRADVSLLSPGDSRILWTTTEQGPATGFVDLRQRAVAKLGDVLGCAVEASAHGEELEPDVLGLYLSGCGGKSDLIMFEPDAEVLAIFRQVTERAPQFAPGWASMALIEVQSFPGTPPPDRAALRRNVIAHLAKAKELGPDLPETIATDAYFHLEDGTKPQHALTVLDRGLERQPNSALLHYMRALYLADVGRYGEVSTAAQRAIALNPLSPTFRDIYISALAYSGRTAAAYAALKEAEAIWPGSTVLDQVRYRLDLRYGDPRAALRTLQQRGSGDLRPLPGDTAWQAFLEARIDPSPARIERVLDGFRERYRRNLGDVPAYLQALGTFGRVDEAYDVVKPALALDSMMANTEILFRQHMRPIRADRRFIALAAKLGLVQYWEKTGVWADFCREPQLPYDCKAEAAKLTPEQRKLAKFIVG